MTIRLARRGGIWLLLLTTCSTACRDVSVCGVEADCSPPATADEAGAPSSRPEGGAPDAAGGAAGAISLGGASSEPDPVWTSGAAGDEPGGGPAIGPVCERGSADCDDSTLTFCETPTTFSFRHCGACNARCDGACIASRCKPAQRLLESGIESFAANASAAYALVSAANDTENLHRFDLESGADTVLTEGLQPGAELLLGRARLYAHYSDRVVSMGLDGQGATTEDFAPESFGVTDAGVYYTSYVTNPNTYVDDWSLWFRAEGAASFKAISNGAECEILGSSGRAVLVRRETAATAEILLAVGSDLTVLGDSPGEPLSALPVADSAAFLISTDSGVELVWLRADTTPVRFELEAALDAYRLVRAPGGVAVTLHDRSDTFVRLFSLSGSEAVRLGITNYSTLAYVDENYLWYSWYGAADASQQFLRAKQFELNDLAQP